MKTSTALSLFCKMAPETTFILLIIGTCLAAPVDEPVKIDLPVYDQPVVTTEMYLLQPLKPENYPGGEHVKETQATEGDVLTYKLEAGSDLLENSLHAKANSYSGGGFFSAPVTTRETALLETEGYASKVLSFKEGIQGFKAGIFQPQPIVDTISESEKYGNTGDKFYSAGKALVGGAESFSNFVNSFLEVPGTIFKTITRSATEKLNNLGGKLIGL